MYGAERADSRALEQLESILREVAEELATWRARALKAEGDGKRGGSSRGEGEGDRQLRGRVEAARTRVQALVSRLAFLEEQARETNGPNASSGSPHR
ncbi:MAG TPA: hypothetical protein VJ816_11185 [Gemmatimonadales bacterium]|nr:hypothetical protein [Gemmatimonadales bacterium]